MTITPLEIYVITRLDIFNAWCGAITVVFIVLTVGYLIAALIRAINIDDPATVKSCDNLMGYAKKAKLHIFFPIFVAITVFVPSGKEMAAIKIIPAIANSEIVQDKVPEALNGLINLANAWMEELSPKKEDML